MEDNTELLYSDKKLNTNYFNCPSCGGQTEFDPKTQKMKCAFCGSVFDIPKDKTAKERPLEELLEKGTPWKNKEVIMCSNCGSKEVVSKGEISTCCSFCGTTNIVRTEDIVGMEPQGLCPFQKSVTEIAPIAQKWARKKVFAPNDFKKSAKPENIHGVYSPAFTFDSVTHSTYSGVLGEDETHTTRNMNGTVSTYTTTRKFNISGTHDAKFDDLIVQASLNIPYNVINKLEPFPTNEAISYNEKYLNGYTANTYSKDGKQLWNDCKLKIDGIIQQQVLSKYRHDRVYSFVANTSYNNSTYKYILLPLYIGHHTYKEKNYNFYINGITGRIFGKSPVSKWKVFFTVLAGILVAGAITLAICLG